MRILSVGIVWASDDSCNNAIERGELIVGHGLVSLLLGRLYRVDSIDSSSSTSASDQPSAASPRAPRIQSARQSLEKDVPSARGVTELRQYRRG